MKNILNLTKRNLLLFFRNKSVVFFSFLSAIIIVLLYVLFLSDLQVLNIKQVVGDVKGISALVNSWVMSGLIAVSTVTLTLGALGQIVADKENNAMNDFLVTPVKREQVFLSYLFSTIIITIILSLALIFVAEIYIINSGGKLLSLLQLLEVLGITVLCILSSSLMMLFIITFIQNEKTLSVFSTILGTLIGFITGAYIPMGLMPKSIQIFSNIFPASQGASLLRKIFLVEPIKEVFGSSSAAADYMKMQGVNLYFGSYELPTLFMLFFIIGSIVIFTIINILRFRNMKNK